MFYQILLGFWAELKALRETVGALDQVVSAQLPSHGMAGTPLSVTYWLGLPRSAKYKSRLMDIKENLITAAHVGNDAAIMRGFVLEAGHIGSYLEAGIYDQAFLMPPGHSMSAVTALKLANDQGIPIYHLTAGNLATVLPVLSVSEEVKSDIANAVGAGLEALVSQRNVSTGSFTGVGYILSDPRTGSGSYRISGGRNGDDSPAVESLYPLPQVHASPLIGLMTRALRREMGAGSLVFSGGLLLGLTVPVRPPALPAPPVEGAPPAPDPRLAALSALLMVLMMILEGTSQKEMDEKYPRFSKLLRHYTTRGNAWAIRFTSSVFASDSSAEFKEGAYFANPGQWLENFPPLNPGVSCPPTPDQSRDIALAYNIPPGAPDPARVTSYVEVELLRQNYFQYDEITNGNGAIEIVVRKPLMFQPAAPSGKAMLLDGFTARFDMDGFCP